MEDIYVVKLGSLYLKWRQTGTLGGRIYKMTDNLNDAIFYTSFDEMKKLAEEIGGKAYKINLEEVK
ncbi:hypothetical protein [Pediococcus pentosaceus]|uniref:hypothetical protein n=1 Tax=Pediococcus pentosaceus TaxID=1255 RepID=UPI002570D712|nr:hypothetical protein [Pediococcus pentosaceus]